MVYVEIILVYPIVWDHQDAGMTALVVLQLFGLIPSIVWWHVG